MLENPAKNFVDNIEKKLFLSIKEKTDNVTFNLEKVLQAFSNASLSKGLIVCILITVEEIFFVSNFFAASKQL